MGKGDKRTAKGKIFAASFGNARPKATKVARKAKKAAKKK
ncbi:MAG: 30S ribosomal protein THX [Deltaproteobacteria bacterium]|nr:30S ribosomal protein THX [Deltaproteobacteria bacterium]